MRWGEQGGQAILSFRAFSRPLTYLQGGGYDSRQCRSANWRNNGKLDCWNIGIFSHYSIIPPFHQPRKTFGTRRSKRLTKPTTSRFGVTVFRRAITEVRTLLNILVFRLEQEEVEVVVHNPLC